MPPCETTREDGVQCRGQAWAPYAQCLDCLEARRLPTATADYLWTVNAHTFAEARASFEEKRAWFEHQYPHVRLILAGDDHEYAYTKSLRSIGWRQHWVYYRLKVSSRRRNRVMTDVVSTEAPLRDMLYHSVLPETSRKMTDVRERYYGLGLFLLRCLPDSRERSCSLTHLEDSLMRAIQCLAVTEGTPVPAGSTATTPHGGGPVPTPETATPPASVRHAHPDWRGHVR